MAANASPLRSLTDNVPPPLTTPGKKVVALTAALEKKDAENEALRCNLVELTNALAGLTVAKDKLDADGTAAGVVEAAPKAKSKKDKDAPAPAKTAYRFYCDAHPKPKAGVNMQQAWKECAPEVRKSYEAMAKADKARYVSEAAAYQEEKAALELYYGEKKQEMAMEFFDAHRTAQAALEKAGAETKKGKKKAKAKDPEAPKRSLSSYMYFVADKREAVAKKDPQPSPSEVMKTLGEMWSQLDKGKAGKKGTKKYDDLAAKDKARYEGEKQEYDAMVAERKEQAAQQQQQRLDREKAEALELLKSRQEAAGAPAAVRPDALILDDMSVVSALTTSNKPKKKKEKKDPNAPKGAKNAYIFFTTGNRGEIKARMPEGTSQQELLTEVGRQWKALAPEEKEKYSKMAAEDKARYAKDMEKYTPAIKK